MKKKAKDVQLGMLTLPNELIFEIMQYSSPETLYSLLLTCRATFNVFEMFRLQTLDEIRVAYLNSKTKDVDFHRVLKLFGQSADGKLGKLLKARNDNAVRERMAKESKLIKVFLKFLSAFNETHTEQLVIAGGFVLSALLKTSDHTDIDIFLMRNGVDALSCSESVRKMLVDFEEELNIKKLVYVQNSSVLMLYSENSKPLQFVLRAVCSIEELLTFFDLDSCRFAFDGKTVFTIYEGMRSLALATNVVQRQHFDKKLYFRRGIKYAMRKVSFSCVYRDLYPFQCYSSVNRVSEMIKKGDIGVENIRHDTQSSKWKVEIGSYTPFLLNVKYHELETVVKMGIDKFIEKYGNNSLDFEEYYEEYEENDFQIPLRARGESLKLAIDRDKHVFATTANGLFSICSPMLFYEPYFDSHLWGKYDILRCYLCKDYRKISYDEERFDKIRRASVPPYSKTCLNEVQDYDWYSYSEFCEKNKVEILKKNQICDRCKRVNDQMKTKCRDLSGQVGIVTGGRIKIGFATCLVLLRNGGTVIATTRFPKDAMERYSREEDFVSFRNRLTIVPLNLKKTDEVKRFTEFISEKYQRIHFLINCAAQTIRYPILYYRNVIKKEVNDIVSQIKSVGKRSNNNQMPIILFDASGGKELQELKNEFFSQEDLSILVNCPQERKDLCQRVRSLKTCFEGLQEEDYTNIEEQKKSFPNESNQYGEPVDKRENNSWTMKPDEIPTSEMLETQLINHISPVMLIQGLFSVMKPRAQTPLSYIVNVTSIEGQFQVEDAFKVSNHAHTNMSKSSLNQMTKTSAHFMASNGIIMNSVDTGWISSGRSTWQPPPLSIFDGAYRVLHPILSNTREYGVLFKDYEKAPW